MKNKKRSFRWILLAIGVAAILGLTGMNVYTLYNLRDSSIETAKQSKKIHVAEFAERIRHRFIHPWHKLAGLEMQKLAQRFKVEESFSNKTIDILYEVSQDSIFENIYYAPVPSAVCQSEVELLKFSPAQQSFTKTENYSKAVCDGLNIARTRMKTIIGDYQFNNKLLFDTHRSMVIALVNLENHTVIGYLVMPIDKKYLLQQYIAPQLKQTFSPQSKAGVTVWLRNWTKQKVLASSDTSGRYNPDQIQIIHRFPDFLDDWRLYASIDEAIVVASTGHSYIINFIILAIAFACLLGALVFMFVTAQREKALAERQSEFLANVTHELKTPLAVMQAAGENLADGRVDNQNSLKKYGSHIYNETLRLRHMIENLLDVAKSDAGEASVKPEPTDISQLLDEYLDENRSYIENRGFTVKTSLKRNLPQIMIDKNSFKTIINNLVSNSLKYSCDDKFLGIYLSKKNNNIILEVEDHGIGISSKSIKHIYEKFYRAEDTLTAQTKGYGLGLSIVKNQIKLNNGSINLKSEKGKRTIFTVKFPAFKQFKQPQIDSLNATKSANNKTPGYAH